MDWRFYAKYWLSPFWMIGFSNLQYKNTKKTQNKRQNSFAIGRNSPFTYKQALKMTIFIREKYFHE